MQLRCLGLKIMLIVLVSLLALATTGGGGGGCGRVQAFTTTTTTASIPTGKRASTKITALVPMPFSKAVAVDSASGRLSTAARKSRPIRTATTTTTKTEARTSTCLSSITYSIEDSNGEGKSGDDNSNGSNYGEVSRAYRRTIYTHEDWKRHRDPSRFFKRALTIFRSGIYWNIRLPVKFVTSVSMFVVLWNTLFKGFQLSLPLQPFTLSSASLGLLLVFRTNTGYGRWDEARKCWGMNM